jgi:peptidoglycan/xylan/chitin deacetylase (PgdA/CDA1 family)
MIIVTYHAVDERRSPVCISARRLRQDLFELRRAGYQFVSMDLCADWLAGRTNIPRLAAAVTFDDGYASVLEEAVPVLKELSVPAIVYAIAGRLGAGNDWPGQWASIPPMRLAGAAELRALVDAGVAIGAHSFSHAALPTLPKDRVTREIQESGDQLEQILGTPVRHFAYPYGVRGRREKALAAARYLTACATRPGVVSAACDRHDLPRLDPHDLQIAHRLRLSASPTLPVYLRARSALRRLRRMAGAG